MTDRPDPADWIAKRRELLAAATEWPWEIRSYGPRKYSVYAPRWPGIIAELGNGAEDATLIADARTSLPRALDALEAVLAPHQLHEVPGGQRWCLHCGGDWPCPTVAALTEALS